MQAYARGRQDGCGAVLRCVWVAEQCGIMMMMEREAVALAAWCQLENYCIRSLETAACAAAPSYRI